MCSRTSPKIWLLMLIPVAVLLGIGWMQRDNHIIFKPPRRTTGPLQMVVTDVKFEDLKPREVAEGFDTKVTLTLDLEGRLPKRGAPFGLSPYVRNVRLVEVGAKPRVTKLNDENVLVLQDNTFTVPLNSNPSVGGGKLPQTLSFMLKLSELKPSRGAVELRADILSLLQMQVTSGITGVRAFPGLKFLFVVRRPDQSIQTHQIDKTSSLQVVSTQVTKLPPNSWQLSYGYNVPVYEVVTQLELKPDVSFDPNSAQLKTNIASIVDEKGHIYRHFQWEKSAGQAGPMQGGGFSSSARDLVASSSSLPAKCLVRRYFPAEEIPLSAGQLTFKMNVSLNDEWPVPVSVIVRPRNFKPPQEVSPFQVVKTQSKAIQADDYDTEVSFWLKPLKPELAAHDVSSQLIVDYSQHTEDSRAIEFWSYYKPDPTNPGTSSMLYMPGKATFDNVSRLYLVTYQIPLKLGAFSRGRITFHAEIGMKGYKFLPVSVVVRP